MSQYIQKLNTHGKDFLQSCIKTFFKSGTKGYLKFALAAYFGKEFKLFINHQAFGVFIG